MPARRMGHKPVYRGSATADLMPSHAEGIVISEAHFSDRIQLLSCLASAELT
jgi:hypothetical protein